MVMKYGLVVTFVAFVQAFANPGDALAQNKSFLKTSLASNLLQSRTQVRILKADDQADLTCKEKAFVAAEVVKTPVLHRLNAKVSARKWQEQWTLSRCGRPVGYRVFFTEVGQGGAYFSFVQNH